MSDDVERQRGRNWTRQSVPTAHIRRRGPLHVKKSTYASFMMVSRKLWVGGGMGTDYCRATGRLVGYSGSSLTATIQCYPCNISTRKIVVHGERDLRVA